MIVEVGTCVWNLQLVLVVFRDASALATSAQELYQGIQERVKGNLSAAPANVDQMDAEIQLTDLPNRLKTAFADICSGGHLTVVGKMVIGACCNPSPSSAGGAA